MGESPEKQRFYLTQCLLCQIGKQVLLTTHCSLSIFRNSRNVDCSTYSLTYYHRHAAVIAEIFQFCN